MPISAPTPLSGQSDAASGFTAIELMVALAVLAVLAALAVPSFASTIDRWRVSKAASTLKTTIHYARSEAIKRGGQVFIQKLPNGVNGCTSATDNKSWDCGWFVCVHAGSGNLCTERDPVLQRFDAPKHVAVRRSGNGASIKFNRYGAVAGTWPSFGMYPLGTSDTHAAARRLCMSSGGRVRVAAIAACSSAEET